MAGQRRFFFAAGWIAVVFLNAYIIAPAPVFPRIMESLQVGNAAAGALISSLLVSAILVQIPGAYVIDRMSNRHLVALSVLGLNLASLPAFLIPRYGVVLASRFVSGLFVPLIFVSMANLVGHAFPEARVRALGVYLAAPPAGYALGTFATPYVPALTGLSSIFIAYAIPLLLLLPIVYWASAGIGEERGPMYPLAQYVYAFKSPELWRLGLAFACTYALYIFFTSWMPTFLSKEGGLSLAASGGLVALVPAFGILSRPLGGFLADGVFRKDKRLIPAVSFVSLLPLSLIWTTGASIPWALLLLPLAGFLVQLPFSVYYAFSSQILPERLMGSAYTFMNTTSLIGGALAPFVAGYLVDASSAFHPAFVFAAALAALGLLLSISSRER